MKADLDDAGMARIGFLEKLMDEINSTKEPGADYFLEASNLGYWELRQLVKSGLYPDEQSALRSALRALFQLKPENKIQMIVTAYQAGDISLGRSAAMLGVSQEEMKDIVREADGKIHLGPQNITELLEDSRNA
jgi:predicted HTH domain antitoxin